MKSTVLFVVLFAGATQLYAQGSPSPAGAPSQGNPATAAAGPRPSPYLQPAPYDFNDHAGWQSMFDGSTLKGWKGPLESWRVENGAIVASSTTANPTGRLYLLWDGDVKNFEFKTEIKLEGSRANSGVQLRAKLLGKTDRKNSEWENFGYQADYDYANGQTGALIECCGAQGMTLPRPQRHFKASPGMVIRETISGPDKPMLVASLGDQDELKKLIRTGDWNELHIIARGPVLTYILNGHVMSELVDDDPSRFFEHGILALQLEGRDDVKVSFRNLWMKTLP